MRRTGDAAPVPKTKNPDFTNVHNRFDRVDSRLDDQAKAIATADEKGNRLFWIGLVIPFILSVGLIFPAAWYGADVGIAADRNAHEAYVDGRRPCLFAEDQLFDLPSARIEYYYDPETGQLHDSANITVTREDTWLFLYVVHLQNTRMGDLRDVRVTTVLPGHAYVTTTDRKESTIDAEEAERVIIAGNDGFPKLIRQDPRLTLARFGGAENIALVRQPMLSGASTPEDWSHIFAWSPNVIGARGNQIVTYTLPVLHGGDEWWIGTWFYQPRTDWNAADKGTAITAWSQGYHAPLYASGELTALNGRPAAEDLTNFCTWTE